MMEEEYQLEYFRTQDMVRKVCTSCGKAFWTRDPERTVCGDAPCEPYQFIGNPLFKAHTVDQMREAYLSFYEKEGHTRISRYPVAARWRDDIYLTIASIADFQPFVTSGVVPPPANPLTISQPCIRLNDLDSVGRSGRHLTCFEMMAHHAFNSSGKEIYWKDRTVELCDQFLASIGADMNRVTYKEHPWIGGGNAGPSVEVLIGGLEVATLVFMSLGKQKTDKPPVMLEGNPYYPMNLRIVDTGYGLERLVWASKGSPTIYDAVFPEMVSHVMQEAGLGYRLNDPDFIHILGENAKFAGLMDISGQRIFELRQKVADQINIPVEKLEKMIAPVESVYAIVDHTRCLSYMLGDCIVPSNVKDGYLARLVIRRTLRMMKDLNIEDSFLGEMVSKQMKIIGTERFEQDPEVVNEIIEREIEKYRTTMERGTRTVERLAQSYKKKCEKIPLSEMVTLYDSHGIPPEMVRDLAAEQGAVVDLPDDFYSQIADKHSESEREPERNPLYDYLDRLAQLPETKKLYYEKQGLMEFEAKVLDVLENRYVVLDTTLYYPEGGGQPGDTGLILAPDGLTIRVEDTIKLGNSILHKISGGNLQKGDTIRGIIDEERRLSLMRHHTATHILLHAAQEVLGAHIHQAGAQKGETSSRMDLRHYKHITPAELKKIEAAANRLVMANTPTSIGWEDRTDAEQKYGFRLYQGGVPPGSRIRVVKVAGDIEACAGTHCAHTGDIGLIKIIRVEHIQDGIERLEFTAGLAAVQYLHQMEGLLTGAAEAFSVQNEALPATAQRFFGEWKDQRKEIERLSAKVSELELKNLTSEEINGKNVLIKRIDLPSVELVKIATSISASGGVALLIAGGETARAVVSSGIDTIKAGDLIAAVCTILGGKGGGKPNLAQGGGPDVTKIDQALASGRDMIITALNG
ncbi:MAG TPA: alanine--tRNA ligase [Methanospirillum sp.]|uniref:alanine--tRNA ligase n=1 Tax=Methanospirillum sp. TaxID=45200 RepID=UPI002BB50914|nr:alanine--tRNA ligase [Methanospirillum sp.]HWQ63593.1 alanine--tRNA ligase [Methanospirillum sp.]